jgi:hypothetical protein
MNGTQNIHTHLHTTYTHTVEGYDWTTPIRSEIIFPDFFAHRLKSNSCTKVDE